MRRSFTRAIVVITILVGADWAQAASKAELWPRWQKHDPLSRQPIDHSVWERFLKVNVIAPHASGINAGAL